MREPANQPAIVLTRDGREAMPLLGSAFARTQRRVEDLEREYLGAVVLFRSGDIRLIAAVTEVPPTRWLARLTRSLPAALKSIDVQLQPAESVTFERVRQRLAEFFRRTDHIEEWARAGLTTDAGRLRQALVDACLTSSTPDELFCALGLTDNELGDQLC